LLLKLGRGVFVTIGGLKRRLQNAKLTFLVEPKLSYDAGLHPQPAVDAASSTNLVTGDRASSRTNLVFLVLVLAGLWFVCCRYFSAEWSFNEQYNYGWFVPFFAAYLFWLRWGDRPEPEVGGPAFARLLRKYSRAARRGKQSSDGRKIVTVFLIICAALILLPLRVFEIGSADWRPLGWIHVVAVATITLSMIYLAGGASWLRHFSFPVLFFFVAVPWPTPIEAPIVQNLMRVIAASAAEVLGLFGIPAEVQGNLIRLPSGMVGVNEACSGVRSLQTSLTIGLLFGELKRMRVGPRLLLIGSAVGIALVANFFRASFLVWIASTRDIAAVARWHDIAGYAVVVLVFAGTMWIAASLARSQMKVESRKAKVEDTETQRGDFYFDSLSPESSPAARAGLTVHVVPLPASSILPSTFYFPIAALLLWIVAVEIGAEFWYRAHERNLVARPAWSVRWPENASGYHEIRINNEVRNMLRFDSGREASWISMQNGAAASQPSANYLFFFRWNPGSGTILRARAHRPDICLPAAGWRQVGSDELVNYRIDANHSLPFRTFHFERETGDGRPVLATAFFTLHEDVAHETEGESTGGLYSNWDWNDRWRVVRNGIRNRGQQVLEVIMVTPAQMSDAAVEEQFGRLARELVVPKKTSE
jgi:exosortase